MPVSKAQQKCVNKYNKSHYDRINLSLPKGYKEKLQTIANEAGESVNGFLKRIIDAELEKGELENDKV